jgi:hypothetical protein
MWGICARLHLLHASIAQLHRCACPPARRLFASLLSDTLSRLQRVNALPVAERCAALTALLTSVPATVPLSVVHAIFSELTHAADRVPMAAYQAYVSALMAAQQDQSILVVCEQAWAVHAAATPDMCRDCVVAAARSGDTLGMVRWLERLHALEATGTPAPLVWPNEHMATVCAALASEPSASALAALDLICRTRLVFPVSVRVRSRCVLEFLLEMVWLGRVRVSQQKRERERERGRERERER